MFHWFFVFLVWFWIWQVKDVLFEPVRKTQDAMFFYKNSDNMFIPCGPKQPGAVQITMQELAAQGLASQVCCHVSDFDECSCWWFEYLWWLLTYSFVEPLYIDDDYQVIGNAFVMIYQVIGNLVSYLFIRTGMFHSIKD